MRKGTCFKICVLNQKNGTIKICLIASKFENRTDLEKEKTNYSRMMVAKNRGVPI